MNLGPGRMPLQAGDGILVAFVLVQVSRQFPNVPQAYLLKDSGCKIEGLDGYMHRVFLWSP